MRERLAGAALAVYPSVERDVRALAVRTKYWRRRNRRRRSLMRSRLCAIKGVVAVGVDG